MAAFPKLVLTSAGIALQTKVQGGATLELTNIQMGSGQLNGQPIGPLTALISSNATVPIQSGQAIGQNTYQVEGFFTNADLSAGFWWREIGIFANDPDNGEILYAYANAGDAGDYIPTVTDQRIEKYIYFSMTLANATTVTVTIPQTDTYVLQSTVGQANGVAGLGENGAVPVAQGGTGAVTASAALAALGGMRASATGDDIPTSASDPTSISSQLSNKVAKTYTAPSQIGITLGNETIESISTALPNGAMLMYAVGASANTEIYPFRLCSIVVYRIDASRVVWTAIDKATGKNATGNWSNDLGFTGWEPSATATPPQEFDLPLADGISGTAKYSKDQFGIVRVYIAVLKNSGTITNNEILGTLPEGFRSKYNFAVVCFGNSEQNNMADRHPINMLISSNGNISASFLSETDGTKIASLYGTAEFLPES